MERLPVESKAIRSMGYDAETRTLEVEFSSGRVYAYDGVEPSLYEWLLRVPSKGAVFNRMVKDHHPERDVTPAAPAVDLVALLARSLEPDEPGGER